MFASKEHWAERVSKSLSGVLPSAAEGHIEGQIPQKISPPPFRRRRRCRATSSTATCNVCQAAAGVGLSLCSKGDLFTTLVQRLYKNATETFYCWSVTMSVRFPILQVLQLPETLREGAAEQHVHLLIPRQDPGDQRDPGPGVGIPAAAVLPGTAAARAAAAAAAPTLAFWQADTATGDRRCRKRVGDGGRSSWNVLAVLPRSRGILCLGGAVGRQTFHRVCSANQLLLLLLRPHTDRLQAGRNSRTNITNSPIASHNPSKHKLAIP